MTECGLCGAAMTGAECRVCGWRPNPTSGPTQPTELPPAAAPTQPAPAPHPRGADAPLPHAVGPDQPSVGVRTRPAWILGGLVVAAVIVGVIAVNASGGANSSLPPAATPPTVVASGSETTPDGDGPGPSEDAGAPDKPTLKGGWITVLDSIPQDDGGLNRARSVANDLHQRYGVDVYVIDSGRYKGLNPGWWAVVMVGFDSNAEARAACATVGRSPSGTCYGRQVKG